MTALPRLTTVATCNDVDDLAVLQSFHAYGAGALNPGRAYPGRDSFGDGWDPLSMEGPHRSTWHLTGYRCVGYTASRAVYVWRFAVNGTSDTRYCAAVVDLTRTPASVVTVHARDYQPSTETTRAGAEKKAAELLAELQPVSAELVAELQADARAAWAAGRPGAPALSAVVMREMEGLPVGTTRALSVMHAWIDAYEAERDAAAAEALRASTPAAGPVERLADAFETERRERGAVARLEYLRGELRAERMSYGELAELQGLAAHIDPGDVELLEAAGVPEYDEPAADAGRELAELGERMRAAREAAEAAEAAHAAADARVLMAERELEEARTARTAAREALAAAVEAHAALFT